MAQSVPPCPPSLKSIQHFLKVAAEHDTRDPIISYWCRLFAMQSALKTDKSSPEAKALLFYLINWLEDCKKAHRENEGITNEVAAQAHLDNYAHKLFMWADSQDRAAVFNKSVIKAFYTAGVIYDVVEIFGELTEEVIHNRKYAKWKAAYINNCLKNGETPVSGPAAGDNESAGGDGEIGFNIPPQSFKPDEKPNNSMYQPPPSYPPQQPAFPPQQPAFPPQQQETLPSTESGSILDPSKIAKAQKYCKYASSALNYEDIPTAILNLQKALTLVQTGVDLDEDN